MEANRVKRLSVKHVVTCLVVIFSVVLLYGHAWAGQDTEDPKDALKQETQGDAGSTAKERLNRIDFGNTYIIGQTIKSGAVYLLQRKKSEIKSMLKYREDYRTEILEGFSVDHGDDPEGQHEEKQVSVKPVSQAGKPDFAESGKDR